MAWTSFHSRPFTTRTLPRLPCSALHRRTRSSRPGTGCTWWRAAPRGIGQHRAERCCPSGLTISASPSTQRSRTSLGGGTSPLRNLPRSDLSIVPRRGCRVEAGGGSVRCTVLFCWACWLWFWSSDWSGSFCAGRQGSLLKGHCKERLGTNGIRHRDRPRSGSVGPGHGGRVRPRSRVLSRPRDGHCVLLRVVCHHGRVDCDADGGIDRHRSVRVDFDPRIQAQPLADRRSIICSRGLRLHSRTLDPESRRSGMVAWVLPDL